MWKPENGGYRPSSIGISFNLFKVPLLGPCLAKLLGGGIYTVGKTKTPSAMEKSYGGKMKLTEHFTIEELTATSHADIQAANRSAANPYLISIMDLASFLLEPIRAHYGPFTISSGFRGPELNARVGGVATSQHCIGQAADLCRADWTWDALDKVANWVKKESGLKFGQVIREQHGSAVWLHISTGMKCEALDFKDGKYYVRA